MESQEAKEQYMVKINKCDTDFHGINSTAEDVLQCIISDILVHVGYTMNKHDFFTVEEQNLTDPRHNRIVFFILYISYGFF